MRALAGLNPEQEKAVKRVDRHLLVVAGAGSGKTRVLTHKIAYLIEECGISPSSIIAMTFSNKAAQEMAERVRLLLPTYEQPRWVGTFHSTCLRILKEFSDPIGLPHQFSIYDETDQLVAVKRAVTELNYDPKRISPKLIRYHIDRAKNETGDVLKYLVEHSGLSNQALHVVERYENLLRENSALDFGSLLTEMVRALRDHSEVAETLRRRWRHILIDEYQDTNRIQKELVHLLAGTSGTVCAVGDEDQSIYGWRGARVENILEFEDDFPGAELIKLEQNYRSTKKILAVANHVISNNIGRRGKRLWTENDEGAAVSFYHAPDDHAEAAFVLEKIDEAVRDGAVEARNVAIFYRTHVQSRLLEEECRRHSQPYVVFGGVRFYDRAEIKDTLAFLKLALNPMDIVSFLRVINTPSKGIGEKTLEQLAAEARERKLSPVDTIPHFGGRGKASEALKEFHAWFTPFRDKAATLSPAEAADIVLTKSGYIKALEKEGTIEAEARIENIEELLRSMEEFSENTGENLATYLDRISLYSDMDKYDPNADHVTMMTMHNAKGLEFDLVFVVGMEEGIFPHQRSIDEGDPNEVEEERRLCYVAMTRARKQLLLTAAHRRRLYHSTQFNPVSRFIGEIPANLIVEIQEQNIDARPVYGSQRVHLGVLPKRKVRTAPFDEFRQESYDDDFGTARDAWGKAALKAEAGSPYAPGTRVLHPDFGVGTIRKREGNGNNLKLTIQFQRAGLKKLMLNYCSLEVIDR
ncbi:MAG TPA: UvrD-helicase domain-containing protein [Bdellovibrionota bacterium]|nr:UvrD-helicase domain-containing protein [Bdellovibrionota bacterium]